MESEITYPKDQATRTVTQLQYFRDVGFSIDHLVGILAHDGGSHNLAALQALVEKKITYTKDQATRTVTQLQYFRDVGFGIDHLVRILAHGGGLII